MIRRWNTSIIKVETSKRLKTWVWLKKWLIISQETFLSSWQWLNMQWTWTSFYLLALTFQSLWMNVLVFYRHLLSADTREDRLLWCAQLNKTLDMLRAWGSNLPVSPKSYIQKSANCSWIAVTFNHWTVLWNLLLLWLCKQK